MRRITLLALGATTVLLALPVVGIGAGLTEASPRSTPPADTGRGTFLPALTEVPACGRRCGVERWEIKTLSDAQRHLVDLTPVRTTVAALGALPRPRKLRGGRAAPAEFRTYQVEAYLAGWDDEADSDVHLILADPENQRATMVAEIPSPECSGACASGLGRRYSLARARLKQVLSSPNPEDRPILLRVTGVGFFDRNHGQIGAAPNGFELHPVLLVEVP